MELTPSKTHVCVCVRVCVGATSQIEYAGALRDLCEWPVASSGYTTNGLPTQTLVHHARIHRQVVGKAMGAGQPHIRLGRLRVVCMAGRQTRRVLGRGTCYQAGTGRGGAANLSIIDMSLDPAPYGRDGTSRA